MIRTVYDLEQLRNFHSCTAYDIDRDKVYVFVIHNSRNDLESYIRFLEKSTIMIGFNNLKYDYPLIHFILTNKDRLRVLSADKINELLYNESQRIIGTLYSEIRRNEMLIPQIDLYRVHHYDNKNRRMSLKRLQFNMRFRKVQDMPIHHTMLVNANQVDDILEYNLNDVMSTYEFYKLSKTKLTLRGALSKKYNTNLTNANDPKIGSEIILMELAKKKNVNPSLIKELSSPVSEIVFKDIILDYIEFKTPAFQAIHEYFKQQVVSDTKGVFKDIPYKNIKCIESYVAPGTIKNKKDKGRVLTDLNIMYDDREYIYGSGGIHMNYKSGIFESDVEWLIVDFDVEKAAS